MTSRERVRKMFRGELTNSFAISVGGMANDNMSAFAYAKLLKYLGMEDKPIRIYDLFQFIPQMDPEVIDLLGGDFVHAQRPRYRFNLDQKQWRPGTLHDGTPCWYPAEYDPILNPDGSRSVCMNGERYARMPKDGLYFDIIRHPLEDAEDPEQLYPVHPAVRMSDEDVDYTVNSIRELYEKTDKAVVLLFAGQLIEQAQRDFGFETFYYNMAAEQELMHAYFRMITDVYLDNLRRILAKAGNMLDVVWFCDDIGTQQTLQISISMYKEMIQPYEMEMWGFIHKNYPDIRVLFHSCGAIFDVIPELIRAGVDLLNPVQISARGMDPERLAETYRGRVMFWGGGTDTQKLTKMTSVEEVRAHAQKLVETFARNGNYIFSQVHNFQADVPPEYIMAIFDTAKEYRRRMENGEL